jgi:hypothetical protein
MMSADSPKQAYARSALRKACQELIRLKSGRAKATGVKATIMGTMTGWIPEEEIYREFLRVSAVNGLLDIDGEISVRATIRDGLEIGRKRQPPAAAELDPKTALPNVPKDVTGAARVARWKAAHREQYNQYMKGYMAFRAAKKRLAGTS